jgi:YVTN family beta-propeller protein
MPTPPVPKLRYDITTEPFPLQASAETGSPVKAQLTIVATNSTSRKVNLQAIIIELPVDKGAGDLTLDASSIGPIAPRNWSLDKSVNPPSYAFTPPDAYPGLDKNKSLVFVFNNVQVNSTPGNVEITITEYGDEDGDQGAIKALEVTKFPHGWGQVTFWADPEIVEETKGTTLHWSGPAGADYKIEYYTPHTDVVNVPAEGEKPLLNEGVYPAKTDPPLSLNQNTTFTLNVTERTSSGLTYSARQQVTVTVETPKPRIKLFRGELRKKDNSLELILRWDTEHAKTCTITGDPHPVTSSSLDDSYTITRASANLFRYHYTLTAEDGSGDESRNATSQVDVEWGEITGAVSLTTNCPCFLKVLPAAPPQNARIFLTSENTVEALDAVTLKPIGQPIKLSSTPYLALLPAAPPQNARLFMLMGDGTVGAFDAITMGLIGKSIQLGRSFSFIAVSPAVPSANPPQNALVFLTGNSVNTVGVLDAKTLQPFGQSIQAREGLGKIAVSPAAPPQNARVFIANQNENTVWVIDALTLQQIGQPIRVGKRPIDVVVVPAAPPGNARIFVANINDNTVTVIDALTLQQIGQPIKTGRYPSSFAVSPDNARVFVANTGDNTLTVIDAVTLRAVGQIMAGGQELGNIGVSPDNARAFLTNYYDRSLSVIERKVMGGTGS